MGLRAGGVGVVCWAGGALSFNLAALLRRGVSGVRQPSGERGHHAVTIIISPSPLLCKLIKESDGSEQSHCLGFYFFAVPRLESTAPSLPDGLSVQAGCLQHHMMMGRGITG